VTAPRQAHAAATGGQAFSGQPHAASTSVAGAPSVIRQMPLDDQGSDAGLPVSAIPMRSFGCSSHRVRRTVSGSCRASQASLAGRLAAAQGSSVPISGSGSPNLAASSAASAVARVSCQVSADRTGRPPRWSRRVGRDQRGGLAAQPDRGDLTQVRAVPGSAAERGGQCPRPGRRVLLHPAVPAPRGPVPRAGHQDVSARADQADPRRRGADVHPQVEPVHAASLPRQARCAGTVQHRPGVLARTVKELVTELAGIQRLGYAVDRQELNLGVWCVAAPILGVRQTQPAAVSVSACRPHLDAAEEERLGELVIAAASRISDRLG